MSGSQSLTTSTIQDIMKTFSLRSSTAALTLFVALSAAPLAHAALVNPARASITSTVPATPTAGAVVRLLGRDFTLDELAEFGPVGLPTRSLSPQAV